MGLSSRADLEILGFSGFIKIADLRANLNSIPQSPGVYSLLWTGNEQPDFLALGSGGRFKGIDPNVDLSTLRANWVAGASIIYIGKAAGGLSGKRGLRKRLTEYLHFGEGRPVGHKGGRYIWQIKDSNSLLVCWKQLSTSTEQLENEMLRSFSVEHGCLPFANLRH